MKNKGNCKFFVNKEIFESNDKIHLWSDK